MLFAQALVDVTVSDGRLAVVCSFASRRTQRKGARSQSAHSSEWGLPEGRAKGLSPFSR